MRKFKTLYYPEDTAPFGELSIERVTYDKIRHYGRQRMARNIHAIGQSGWGNAPWMEKLFGDEAKAVAAKHFNPNDPALVAHTAQELMKSVLGGANTYLFADSHGPFGDSHEVGFARIKSDVSKADSWAKKASKRAADVARNHLPERVLDSSLGQMAERTARVYACVGDVTVASEYQHRHVGVALAEAGLRLQPQRRRVTTWIEEANTDVREMAESFGFEPMGSHPRNDLFGAQHPVEEVGYRSEGTVKDVRMEIANRFPWIKSAVENPTH